MTALMFFSALVLAWLWGTIQAMVMIRPRDERFIMRMDFTLYGVRSHEWFGQYHRLLGLTAAMFAAVSHWWPWERTGFTIGTLVLAWTVVEVAYSFARYARLLPEQENVLGSGWYVRGRNVILFHATRTLAGVLLLFFV